MTRASTDRGGSCSSWFRSPGAVDTKERSSAMNDQRAHEPEDITRLLVERIKAGDAEGVAALYEPD